LKSGYSSGEDMALSADYYNNAKPSSSSLNDSRYLVAISEVKNIQSPFLLYPQNISLSNLLYFLIVPTLCYQLNYPRNDKIKWDKVFFIVFRLIVVSFAVLFAIEQYIKPTLAGAIEPMEKGDIPGNSCFLPSLRCFFLSLLHHRFLVCFLSSVHCLSFCFYLVFL
jgi:hypothetical protein